MAITLYDLSVASFLQTLEAVSGFLDKAAAHCKSQDIALDDIVQARVHPDMLPFSFQILSVAHHSHGAIEGVKKGVFAPPGGLPEGGFAELQAIVREAEAGLRAVTPDEINALEGKDVTFELGRLKLPFTAEGFLTSFSLPNFHFHATTAYGILRARGVPLGKRDYMGKMRMKA